jgi:hypothetical protein
MTKYTVRRVTVEEVEVISHKDAEAMSLAQAASDGLEKYSFGQLGIRVVEQHLEITRRSSPPACGVNDDGTACERPATQLHYKLEQRVCDGHYKTMVSA